MIEFAAKVAGIGALLACVWLALIVVDIVAEWLRGRAK